MAAPIDLPGFVFERVLGSGGYADVHLCSQELPRRRVAVKILRETVANRAARSRFESEANLMAAVSTHPSIVTIHHAAVADDGRPYLVMEYCSRPNLADQCRSRVLSVPEMLHTFVRLAGAVETAHRSGILHRDIKPANVLTTDYGWPALSDFGISSLAGADGRVGALSLPWAPPEAVLGRPLDRRSDVYSLAATAYTVLTGRPPFSSEQNGASPDERTDATALATRIVQSDAPPTRRADVPEALERVLAMALAKDPRARPQTASEFARSLQRIEHEMHLPVTHLDVAQPDPARGDVARVGTEQHGTDEPGTDQPGLDQPDDATSLSVRGTPEDATSLSVRGVPDDATSLSVRALPDDATTLSARAGLDDAASLSERGAPDDATTLSDREDRLDDATRFVPRTVDPGGGSNAPSDDDATSISASVPTDHTVLASPRTPGRPDTTADAPPGSVPGDGGGRRSYTPGTADVPERIYRVRDRQAENAPIERMPIRPPEPADASATASAKAAASDAAAKQRRRARGVVVAVVGSAIVVIGAAAAGIVVLLSEWGAS